MRISDWSSDVCSSDLPAPPSEKSPLGVRPREAADTAALTRDCSDCTAAPSDAVLAATEFAAACSAVFLNCSAAAALAAADAVSPYRSEEHTSELQSLIRISYAVFCLKHKNKI